MSLPSRERGLKCEIIDQEQSAQVVAPLAGAWIEILAPFHDTGAAGVAPLAGAWIEIVIVFLNPFLAACRSPRGSVD